MKNNAAVQSCLVACGASTGSAAIQKMLGTGSPRSLHFPPPALVLKAPHVSPFRLSLPPGSCPPPFSTSFSLTAEDARRQSPSPFIGLIVVLLPRTLDSVARPSPGCVYMYVHMLTQSGKHTQDNCLFSATAQKAAWQLPTTPCPKPAMILAWAVGTPSGRMKEAKVFIICLWLALAKMQSTTFSFPPSSPLKSQHGLRWGQRRERWCAAFGLWHGVALFPVL